MQTTASTETPTGTTTDDAASVGKGEGSNASGTEVEATASGEGASDDLTHAPSDLKDSVVARTTEDVTWEASRTAKYQVFMGVHDAVTGDYVTATFDATAADVTFDDDRGYFSSIEPVPSAEAGKTTYKMILSDKGSATEGIDFAVSFKTVGSDSDQMGSMQIAGEKVSYTVKAATSSDEDEKADSAAGTASRPGVAQRPQVVSAGNDVSSYFHATITSNLDSYPSDSTAIYSVKYSLDHNSVREGDFIYVTVPKSVASSVDLSVSSQHFKSTEKSSETPDDITYKLTFGPNAGSALSGGFSMFVHTNKVDKTTKGSIRVGSAIASITVNPSGSSSGGTTGTETRAISKDANGKTDGSLAYGGWDTSDGRDRASIISVMTKVPTYVTYRVFVNPKKGNLKNVTVTDLFPDGMHLEEGSVTVKDWDTGEEIAEGYTLDAESGSLRFESSEISGHEYCISYRLRFNDGENPSKGKYKNDATITYEENGSTYSESKGSIVQGADYSASNGEKSVDKSTISDDPSDQTVTYTIKFWNNNGFKAGEINLADNLDKYVEYTGAAANDYFSVRQDPNDPQKILITNTKDISGDQTIYVRFTTDFSKVPVGYTVSNTVGGNTTKTTKVGGSVLLSAKKTVDGKAPTEDQKFDFELLDESGNVLQTVQNSGGDVAFNKIDYSKEDLGKTYTYKICEKDSGDGAYVRDSREYTATVKVAGSVGQGGKVLTSVTYKDAAGNAVDVPAFNNRETTSVKVTKVWDDNGNTDGIRPSDGATVQLYANGSAQGSPVKVWDSHTWKDLPACDADGNQIAYTVDELNVAAGYDKDIKGDAKSGFTITNTERRAEPETRYDSITINKRDAETNEALAGATFGVYRDSACATEPVLKFVTDGNAKSLSTEADLKGYVPQTGQSSHLYLKEISAPEGYDPSDTVFDIKISSSQSHVYTADGAYKSVTTHTVTVDGQSDLTVYNSKSAPKVKLGVAAIKVHKTLDGRAPEGKAFTFELRDSDGKVLKTAQNNGGDVAFDKIEYGKADLGKTYTYTISERSGSDSSTSYDDAIYTVEVKVAEKANPDGTIDTTATYKDGSGKSIATQAADGTVKGTLPTFRNRTITSIKVSKSWDDNDNADGIRPQSVKAQLYANGEKSGAPLTLDASNGWAAEWTSLFSCDEQGSQIKYTVREENAPDGYRATVAGDAANGFVLTNTENRREERVDNAVTVTKTDANGSVLDGATFGLYEDEGCNKEVTTLEAGTATISTSNEELAAILPAPGESRVLYLREDQAPKGYVADPTVRQVVISANSSGEIKDDTFVRTTTYGIKVDGAAEVKVPNAKICVAATVHATKTLDGKAPTQDQKFDFELLDESGNVIRTAQNDGGNVTFDVPGLSSDDLGKTLAFKMREKTGNDASIDYDDSEYTVKVEVAAEPSADGSVETKVSYEDADGGPVDTVRFRNVTKPSRTTDNAGRSAHPATNAMPSRVVGAVSSILPQTGDGTSYLVPGVLFVAGIALVILGTRKRRS